MSVSVSVNDLLMGSTPRLDDLVDRGTLTEVLESFYVLFRLPVRVFNADGLILAEALGAQSGPVCQYVDGFAPGRAACESTVAAAKTVTPPLEGDVTHACFTGAIYKIFAVAFDGRAIGKVALGPYVPGETREVPHSLVVIDPRVDPDRAGAALAGMPRVRAETAQALIRHLRGVIDVILFSGHRALLMSQMHVASVREGYRELQAKSDELARSYERLKELDRLKSSFLATVSHELRTPLTSIIGYSEMLSEGIGGTLSAEQREFVDIIRERGEQLLQLITSLLDLGKLEQGPVTITPGSVALSTLAADVVATFMPKARRRNVQLNVATDPSTPDAYGDRERLRQVLTNLVDNAIKFTPPGGQVRLQVRPIAPLDPDEGTGDDVAGIALLGPARQDVEVRIQDTGIGIPAHERDRIFDAFYQVDSSSTREYGGAGLGLAIVKRIVEGHRGRLSVEARDNGPGTVFVVQLPGVRT